MENNLDLTEILKNVPNDSEFYAEHFGILKFRGIDNTREYPIRLRDKYNSLVTFSKEGLHDKNSKTPVILYPSKTNKNWYKYKKNIKKYKGSIIPKINNNTKNDIKDNIINDINLVELLKNVPKGTPLYHCGYGIVYFDKIVDNNYPIVCNIKEAVDIAVTKEGKLFQHYDGECVLFPSKENRDWKQFVIPSKPVMVSNDKLKWELRYYHKNNNSLYILSDSFKSATKNTFWNYIIPVEDFDFKNPNESLKYNIIDNGRK